jgi:hypothetical protein
MEALKQQGLAALPQTAPARETGRATDWRLHLWQEGDPARARAEDFIRARFQDSYDADVRVFMPWLLGITNREDDLTAVIGFRPATATRLFLENYLDQSAEQSISTAIGSPVSRNQIVEVGNLASSNAESVRILMIALVTLLGRLPDARWMMCTAGERLIRLLQRTRFFPQAINQAVQARLSPEDGDWGSYYQNTRQVVAGNVVYGLRELKRQGIWRADLADQIDRILQDNPVI